MNSDHPDLPLEQQRNAEYLERLKTRLARPIHYQVSRSRNWVDPNPNGHGKSYDILHPLLGRVGLTQADESLGTSFYIGARRIDGDIQTVSWLAPVARTFFQPGAPFRGLGGEIAAIRTFTCQGTEVVDLDEEWFRKSEKTPFSAQALTVAAPATRSARRRLAPRGAPETEIAQPGAIKDVGGPTSQTQTAAAPEPQSPGMRAFRAVTRRLSAPRSKELVSVLATLQPDQHALVTRPPTVDLVVQGHPGTGKTVVAAYRAGYLITPNDPDRHELGGGQQRVLLIGPTKGYVTHVSGLVRPFQRSDGGTVDVTDLGTFMSLVVEIRSGWSGGIDGERDDLDSAAILHVKKAAKLVRRSWGFGRGKDAARDDLAKIYQMLVQNGLPHSPITTDPATQAWLRKLPPFDEALALRRYLPLLAQCRMAQRPPPIAYDHIIVDEAQDVSPIEWSLLKQFQHPWNGHWTLVGDQNQRRTNLSHTSWAGIINQLDLGSVDAPLQPEVMTRGYRSTNEILSFADGLLSPALRQAGSVQGAGAPVQQIKEPKSKRVYSRAAAVAADLARRHVAGTTALITVYPQRLTEQMATDGWRRPDPKDFRSWSLNDVTVQVFSPERARGLEFDAVVVIEPRHFDNDNGRHSQLYTSLTRANRELAVVYHQGLPAGLRGRG